MLTDRVRTDRLIQEWLDTLRVGNDAQKITARRGLAQVFQQQGMLREAVDLLVANLGAGGADAGTYLWLAQLYRACGDEVSGYRAATQAFRLVSGNSDERELAAVVRSSTSRFRRVGLATVGMLTILVVAAAGWMVA